MKHYPTFSSNAHYWRKASDAGYAYQHAKRTKNRRRAKYWNRVLQYWSGMAVGMSSKKAKVMDPTLS